MYHAYIHMISSTYVDTVLHIHIHTYTHTYVHGFVHTYIHSYVFYLKTNRYSYICMYNGEYIHM